MSFQVFLFRPDKTAEAGYTKITPEEAAMMVLSTLMEIRWVAPSGLLPSETPIRSINVSPHLKATVGTPPPLLKLGGEDELFENPTLLAEMQSAKDTTYHFALSITSRTSSTLSPGPSSTGVSPRNPSLFDMPPSSEVAYLSSCCDPCFNPWEIHTHLPNLYLLTLTNFTDESLNIDQLSKILTDSKITTIRLHNLSLNKPESIQKLLDLLKNTAMVKEVIMSGKDSRLSSTAAQKMQDYLSSNPTFQKIKFEAGSWLTLVDLQADHVPNQHFLGMLTKLRVNRICFHKPPMSLKRAATASLRFYRPPIENQPSWVSFLRTVIQAASIQECVIYGATTSFEEITRKLSNDHPKLVTIDVSSVPGAIRITPQASWWSLSRWVKSDDASSIPTRPPSPTGPALNAITLPPGRR
jgi:hypothetical protein